MAPEGPADNMIQYVICISYTYISSALRAYPATVPHNDIDNANVDNDDNGDNDDNDDAKNDNNSNWQKLPFPWKNIISPFIFAGFLSILSAWEPVLEA